MSRPSLLISDVLTAAIVTDHLHPSGRLALGLDIATTEKETSNPSALAVVQEVAKDYYVRLLMRWKTADPEITLAIVDRVLMLLLPRRPRRLCVDSTSERFFAARIKKSFGGRVAVDLVVASETTEYFSEKMTYKAYTGNLLVNTIEDGRLGVPNAVWVRDDFRLVKREKGSFVTGVDEAGNHGDSFDAVKLALHGLATKSGPAVASAAATGTLGGPAQVRPGIRNPFARQSTKPSLHV